MRLEMDVNFVSVFLVCDNCGAQSPRHYAMAVPIHDLHKQPLIKTKTTCEVCKIGTMIKQKLRCSLDTKSETEVTWHCTNCDTYWYDRIPTDEFRNSSMSELRKFQFCKCRGWTSHNLVVESTRIVDGEKEGS